ncbi:MAG: peptidyl-prolyl cis-trans isomerase [Caulobacterales bacterium]|nr:peptidyl-prolyl cis-trans isomerase [Caulobacterales bacterium]
MTATAPPAAGVAWLDIRTVHPRRALILMGAGAGLGLVLAGAALFTAKGTTTLVVPADAVAMVNQQPISRIDFDGQLRALAVDPAKATPAMRRQVLNDMIREELYVQRAKELDVGLVDPEVRSAMVKAVEAQAAADAITSKPDSAELRGFYDKHRDKYASEGVMVVRDLVFPPAAAAQARTALAAGAAPEVVATRFGGRDTGKTSGEEFYFAARIHLGEALFTAARALKTGEVSEAIADADGAHLLVMARNTPPAQYDFETARAQVATDYQAAAVARYQGAEDGFLRRRANVLVAKDLK